MAKPGATGVTRIINATGYSMKGLKSAWINEAAFRQELMLILLLIPILIFNRVQQRELEGRLT